MQEPLVTVITPCFNASQYLSQCIDSVQRQALSNWEHIIVDDQSTDGSREIISTYETRDKRIRLIESANKLGASRARNLAINLARGKYIAFLDADDWWHRDKLEKQIKIMEDNNAKFACTAYNIVDKFGTMIRIQNVKFIDRHSLLIKRTVVGCLTVVFDRKYFDGFHFSEDMRAVEDYEMWCRMLTHLESEGGKCIAMPEPLASYRVHPGGKSRRKFARIKLHFEVYRNRLKLPLAYALFCTINYIINGLRDRIENPI